MGEGDTGGRGGSRLGHKDQACRVTRQNSNRRVGCITNETRIAVGVGHGDRMIGRAHFGVAVSECAARCVVRNGQAGGRECGRVGFLTRQEAEERVVGHRSNVGELVINGQGEIRAGGAGDDIGRTSQKDVGGCCRPDAEPTGSSEGIRRSVGERRRHAVVVVGHPDGDLVIGENPGDEGTSRCS